MPKCACVIAGAVLLCSLPAGGGLLSVPKEYAPKKAWPVIVSYQDNPSVEQMKTVPYFLVHAGGKGMQATNKTRTYLKDLARRYNIDPLRVYGTGFSRGGQEVLQQAWEHPHWFAAIAPVCNDLRRKPDRNLKDLNVKYLGNVPALLLHGEHDSFRRTGQILFGHMKGAGCPVQFRTYPGGHSPQLPFKDNVRMLTDFFDKHKLDPCPKQVVHIVTHKRYSRAFWVDSTLVRDADGMKGVFRVTVKKGNRIEVQANEQVSALSLELNDKLVDMKRPVTVVLVSLPPALATQPAGGALEAGEKQLYKGPAISPLRVRLREGLAFGQERGQPLWEALAEIRRQVGKQKPSAN